MSEHITKLKAQRNSDNGMLVMYIFGFIWSILLTLTAYFWVVSHIFPSWMLVYAIGGLAFVQCAVQLYFFLHVTAGSKPRWKLISFGFMTVMIAIIVIGSIWIMHSLSYRMLTPTQITKYMNDQVGL